MGFSLFKAPGCYVFGFFGEFGTGKTLSLIEQGFLFAAKFRRKICTNFYLNESEVRKFGRKYNLPWLSVCLIKHSLSVDQLFHSQNSIILLDEAGISFFSRDWKALGKSFTERFFKLRHYQNYLLYTAQDASQVDVQIRRRTHICVFCRGIQQVRFDHSSKSYRSDLLLRNNFAFDQHKFSKFDESIENRFKLLYPYWQSNFRFYLSPTGKKEQDLFKCYSSFDIPKDPITSKSRSKIYLVNEGLSYDNKNQYINSKLSDFTPPPIGG